MLALIAGTGDLPPALLDRLGARPLVCALNGNTPSVPVDLTFRLETLGSLIADLRAAGVTRLCMAGAIARPALEAEALDAATRPLVPRLLSALGQGDDGALRVVMALFEEAGIGIVAAHEIAPDLLPPEGVPTRAQPPEAAREDARRGQVVLAEMGRADSGQACVIGRGRVIAREGPDGTEAMLRRLRPARDEGGLDTLLAPVDLLGGVLDSAADWLGGPKAAPLGAAGALLYKGPKPGQDRRADLPLIGPETATQAAEAGLAGIVIEASGVMVLDRDEVIRRCDATGLFLWVRG